MNPAHFVLDERLAAESQPLCRFELSDVRLMNDANYPWLILVPRIAGVRELIDLDAGQRRRLGDETDRAARLLRDAFRPRKLNVAALGNVVAQLHVHVIARFEDDPAWPAPVWGRVEARPYSPEALIERIDLLQGLLHT
ncbi:MAG: HIT family protein [Dokdonella sp.]|uniref:HIT family protein n=1 Tax=Dokdonella sp. TaxID=2291710 RepID=UPI002B6B0594|nr:HIT family protein [Xanthomonadales bacterium]HQV72937.1 HIT family protein [Dokdonella sp.]MBK7209209.1 HIT family protein [Xanthomonadales bacterium]MBL0223555.1 HIT family protein [Xanthomonadales bacterium]HQW77230.1 HIT family protein [Dokdonella sp.]